MISAIIFSLWTGSYVIAWKRGIAILTAGNVKVSPDPRISLVNGHYLQIENAVPQDGGEYVCQIAMLEPIEITHLVDILGRYLWIFWVFQRIPFLYNHRPFPISHILSYPCNLSSWWMENCVDKLRCRLSSLLRCWIATTKHTQRPITAHTEKMNKGNSVTGNLTPFRRHRG